MIRRIFARVLILLPIVHYKQFVYKLLGVNLVSQAQGNHKQLSFFMGNPNVVGDYHNIYLHDNSEVERCCTIVANDKFELGENSTLAYGVTILTSADPNGPRNKLSSLYPPIKEPVIIGHDCWIGANSTILPGVTIGDYCVVAAGSVVTKDVPSGSLVSGNPAVIKKRFDQSVLAKYEVAIE